MIAQDSSEAPDKAGTDNGHNGGIDLDCIITDTETSERVNKDLLTPELPTNTEKQDKNLSKTVLNNGNQHFLSIPSLKENPPRNRNVGSRSVSGRKQTIRQKKTKKTNNRCVFQVSRPYLGFCPDPEHFIVNCEQNVVKFAGKWGKMY